MGMLRDLVVQSAEEDVVHSLEKTILRSAMRTNIAIVSFLVYDTEEIPGSTVATPAE